MLNLSMTTNFHVLWANVLATEGNEIFNSDCITSLNCRSCTKPDFYYHLRQNRLPALSFSQLSLIPGVKNVMKILKSFKCCSQNAVRIQQILEFWTHSNFKMLTFQPSMSSCFQNFLKVYRHAKPSWRPWIKTRRPASVLHDSLSCIDYFTSLDENTKNCNPSHETHFFHVLQFSTHPIPRALPVWGNLNDLWPRRMIVSFFEISLACLEVTARYCYVPKNIRYYAQAQFRSESFFSKCWTIEIVLWSRWCSGHRKFATSLSLIPPLVITISKSTERIVDIRS